MLIKNKNNHLFWIALIMVFGFSFLLWYAESIYRYQRVNYTEITSQEGVWDLSSIDFSTTIVRLQGDVEYIENQILNPQQFAENEHLVALGNPIDTNAGRTARLTILLPDDDYYQVYTTGDYARTVYINNTLIGQFGQVATNEADFEPGYGEIIGDIKAENNRLNLIVQGANFAHREGGPYNSSLIGKPELVHWFTTTHTLIESVAIGMLTLLFVFHLLLAVVSGNYRLNLLFSFTCLIFNLRLSLVGSKVLFELFPNLLWEPALKAEYMAISLSAVLILEIINIQFKKLFNPLIFNIFRIALIIFSILFIFIDTFTLSQLMAPLNIVNSLAICYISLAIIKAYILKPQNSNLLNVEQKITIISFLTLFLATIIDTLYYSGIYVFGINNSLAELAILLFSIGQTISIFYISIKNLNEAQIAEQNAILHANNLESLNKMKGEFLQDMSHEMKTPLTVISSGTDYVTMQVNNNNFVLEKVNTTLAIIKEETTKLGRMISGMIDMETMMISENRRKLDFGELLNNNAASLAIWAAENNNKIISTISPDLPPVFGDYQSLMMVINNIMSNAIKYTENGIIRLNAVLDQQLIVVKVSDTGRGISPELLNKVSQRGVSGSGSMGLGLYICQSIVHAHGGRLKIESVLQQGTTVTFTLPIYGGQEDSH